MLALWLRCGLGRARFCATPSTGPLAEPRRGRGENGIMAVGDLTGSDSGDDLHAPNAEACGVEMRKSGEMGRRSSGSTGSIRSAEISCMDICARRPTPAEPRRFSALKMGVSGVCTPEFESEPSEERSLRISSRSVGTMSKRRSTLEACGAWLTELVEQRSAVLVLWLESSDLLLSFGAAKHIVHLLRIRARHCLESTACNRLDAGRIAARFIASAGSGADVFHRDRSRTRSHGELVDE